MTIQLRNYQTSLADSIVASGESPTLAVLPTGGGKTATAAEIARRWNGRQVMFAHRRELIVQISHAFARAGVPHRIIAPSATREVCIERQIKRLGTSWVHDGADAAVASVDARVIPWLATVGLWQIDEGHHVQPNNKWGRAIAACERAFRGVAWTATPMRADGRPMAHAKGGIYRELIEGPNTANLVAGGYITPVDAYSLPPAFDRTAIRMSQATGDFSAPALREATAGARIYGNVVSHYLRFAAGLRGVTFCVDRGEAERQAEAFRNAGVPAAALVDGIGDRARLEMLDTFERGELMQITSVDIIGEGLDIPAIGVVSLARATESAPLHYQQIGRVRRPAPGKRAGIIIDHVGNLLRHGLTDGIVSWSLEGGARRQGNDGKGIPIWQCGRDGCWRVYESWRVECPYCGWCPPVVPASTPSVVEGDLLLYTPELMEGLARRAAEVVRPAVRRGAPRSAAEAAIRNRVDERAAAQTELRAVLDAWGERATAALGESGAYRRFYLTFGVDAATARTLGTREARELQQAIARDLS